MNRCVFILPYFGHFNNYFPLFLKSCGTNTGYNWLIITNDTTKYNYPTNVEVIIMAFTEFCECIQKKFDFPICIEQPHKLCDFKPAYGYILEDKILKYDYWGHCDCDLLFGDLESLLTPLLYRGYNKIFAAGHLTIYKNTRENNRRFMNPLHGEKIYRQAFGKFQTYIFDEVQKEKNVHYIFKEENASVYEEDLSFNCSLKYHNFRREPFDPKYQKWCVESYRHCAFYWNRGKLQVVERKDGEFNINEYIYMHLQGRSMKVSVKEFDADIIQVLPGNFKAVDKIPNSLFEWIEVRKKVLNYRVFRLWIRRLHGYFNSYRKKK